MKKLNKLAKNNKQKIVKYDNRYFKKKYKKYRVWENEIGKYIVDVFGLKSILDLGCGIGSYLEGSSSAGCKDICGVELKYGNAKKYIVKSIFPYIKYGDVTKNINLKHKFDCVISFEVAEHINPNGTDIFVNNLVKYTNKYIIFTAAPPGQPGRGHINLRKRNFWIKLIESKGVVYDEKIVKKCKKEWEQFDVPIYILKNLIIFKKV